ncbi:MAG TPA: penicillin-binding transpeptidase domain-containing protein, partial [Blastocatellia bacterium]
KAEGFMPQGSNRPVRDFEGEVHGTIGLEEAFKVSCNQYFAQLGLKLGKERLANYASRLKFTTSPDDKTRRLTEFWQIAHGKQDRFDYIFAPPVTKMNLASKATSFDVALQSFGQGYDDLTVMSMALITAAASSADGSLVAPTFEVGAPRKVVGPFISPQAASSVRALMRLVVEQGTASGAFAPLAGRITAGGKTGTADRDVPVYDKQGNQVVDYVDKDGDRHYKIEGWTDSWFVGIAPADNPQIVYAVIVENGGQGARAAAPIAVKLIEKAAQLGHIKGFAAAPVTPPAGRGNSRGARPANTRPNNTNPTNR